MNIAPALGVLGHAPPGAPVGAPQPAHRTYQSLYGDTSSDPFEGNYVNLYHEYSTAGRHTPASLRDGLYSSGNAGSAIHILVHVREAQADPADPGYIVAYHRLTRHVARFGQVGRPYDGHGHAFMGDVVDGQVPVSVQVGEVLFNQLPAVQVPTSARMAQLLAAEPDAQLVGPFQAGDPDVGAITTRGLVVVPNEFVLPLLTVGLRPRQAYELLVGLVAQRGQAVACEPLLDWLRVALTRRGQDQPPRTATLPLTIPTYMPPEAHNTFVDYRRSVAHQDLPLLSSAAQQQGAQVIANGLATLVEEQRLTRQEAADQRRQRDARKTPHDFYGILLERLMRWTHVSDERQLPPVHEELANNKKSRLRGILQTAIEECLFTNDFVEDFPVSTALASKVLELSWHSALPDDFTCGLNLFAVGALEEDAVETQRQQNRQADLLTANDGTASLSDIAEVTTPKGDLTIPKTFAQLRYLVQRMFALWTVLMGPQHPLTLGYRDFQEQLIRREKYLESVEPYDPSLRYMVPALVGRWLQLRTNVWLQTQAKSAAKIAPPDFGQLFEQMTVQERWEPRFPTRYMSPPSVKHLLQSIATHTIATPATDNMSAISALTPGTAPDNTPTVASKATTIRNDKWKDCFQKYKAMGIRTATLRDHLKERKIAPPKNNKGQEMCIAWHVVGMCNLNCKRSETHAMQSPTDEAALLAWCESNYNLSS